MRKIAKVNTNNELLVLEVNKITYSRTRQVKQYEPETLEISINYSQGQNVNELISTLKNQVNQGLNLTETNSFEGEFK